MRLTIITEDQCVGIEGEYISPINLDLLDPTIHAVQWYGEYGEVEYKTRFENGVFFKPLNTLITDISPYQFAINAWNVADTAAKVAAQEAAEAAEKAALELPNKINPESYDFTIKSET
jgi:hypothetical protein